MARRIFVLYVLLDGYSAQQCQSLEDSSLKFPPALREGISRYRRMEDRCSRILGKWLMLKACEIAGCPHVSPALLEELSKDDFGRPLIRGTGIDLNLTHSGECVLCAAMPQSRVGVDVERLRAVRVGDFQSIFAPRVWARIQAEEDQQKAFFREWTRLEAVTKADGRGLRLPTQSVDCVDGVAVVDGHAWYLHEIALGAGYACHVAAAMKDAELVVKAFRWDGSRLCGVAE